MKRTYSTLLSSILLILSLSLFAQNENAPTLRGARPENTIPSLDKSYCSNETNDDITPPSWNAGTLYCNWRVYTVSAGIETNHTDWYTVTGTGKTTVLHFNPTLVPSSYYGQIIAFEYTQSDGIGKLSTAYDYTYVYKVPDTYAFGKDTTICPGGTATLKLSSSESNVNYILYQNGSRTSTVIAGTGGSLDFPVTTSGTYTVIAKQANDSTCITNMTGSAIVGIFTVNTPTITGTADVCIGSNNAIYSTESGQSDYEWTISSGGIITAGATTNQIAVTWHTSGDQTLTVNYANSNSCKAQTPTSKTVVVHPLPVPTISGSSSVCNNSSVTYTTQSDMTNYVWTVTGGTITAGVGTKTITVNWTTLGAQTVSVTYKDTYGCNPAVPTPLSVMVKDRPLPSLTGATALCQGTTGVLYTTDSGQSSYTWTISSGGTIVSGGSTNQIVVNWTGSGAQTVTVNYTNSNGCRAVTATSYNVTVYPLPVPTISGASSLCLGETNTVYTTEAGQTAYNWTVSSGGTIVSGANTNTLTVNWTTAGTKTVSVNYQNSNGCTAASATSYSVTVNALPTPIINGSDTICEGITNVSYNTSSGQSNYDWNISGGTITSGLGTYAVKVTWTSPGDKWISVNYKNAAGCQAATAKTKNVYVKASPTPTISGPQVFCLDSSSVKIYNTEIGKSSYVWTVSSGGTIVSGQATRAINVKWSTAGNKTVTVTYTDPNGCSGQTSYDVLVNDTPTPTISGLSTACVGSTGVLYTTESGMSGYTWTVSSGGTITSGLSTNQIAVTWTSAGSRAVTVNYANSVGCTAKSATIDSITVAASPTPSFTYAPGSACIGATNVTYITQAGMNNYDWQITGGTITNGTGTNQVSVTWNTLGTQNISVNYENASGCKGASPASKSVIVYDRPVPTITGSASTCINNTYTYSTETGMSSYIWAVSGGTIISGQSTNSVSVKWTSTGSKTISVTYNNAVGCAATTPTVLDITVNSLPTPTITGLTSVCVGTTGVTYTTEAGMSTYNWTVQSGGTITAGAGTNQITVTWNSAGTKAVSVNYSNVAGCTASTATTDSVTVIAAPTPSIASGTFTVCEGTTSVLYATQAGMSNYNWQVSSGGSIVGGVGTYQVTVNWNTPGSNTISVNYENSNGCNAASPASRNVTVVAKPIPTITGSSSACLNDIVSYTTETAMNTYVWNIPSGGTIISGSGTNTITVKWTTTGVKTISVTYKNANGCVAATPTTLDITVNPIPSPTITGALTVCQGSSGNTYTTESGMSNYTWSIGSGGTITAGLGTNQITVTWNASGKKAVTVNYSNASGCLAQTATTDTVTVNPTTTPSIGGLTTICMGGTVTYSTQVGMNNYDWNVSSGGTIVSGNGTYQITVNWTNVGSETVSVNYENSYGCKAASPTKKDISVIDRPIPVITGATQACLNQSSVYTTQTGMSSYVWNVPSGGTITSGSGTNSITVLWNSLGAQTVTVNYNNAGGCAALTPTIYNVTVNDLPAAPTITGLQSVCAGTSGVTYTTEAGMSNYSWTVQSGGTITAGLGTNQISVTWSTHGKRTVSVNYSNAAGCFAAAATIDSVTVNSYTTPIISGNTSVCINSTQTYTTQTGMNNYVWNLSEGGTIASGSGTYQITVNWSTVGKHTLSVSFDNANGCPTPTPTNRNITVLDLPIPTISGSTSACQGQTSIYTTESGMSSYNWTVSSGGTIISGENTNTVTVQWNSTGAQTVYVNYVNAGGCTASSPSSFDLTVNASPASPTIKGLQTVCNGTTGVVYTTESGMSNYSWSIQAGGLITAGLGTNSVTVNWVVAGKKALRVNYSNAAGCYATNTTIDSINVIAAPTPSISGAASVCDGASSIYTTQLGMNNYTWNVSGGTITSGAGTYQITVNWTTVGNNTISVNYENASGCSSASPATKSVNVLDPPLPTISGLANTCQNTTTTYTTESGMSSYNWAVTGGTITAGAGTYQITVNWATTGSKTITVNYKNAGGCQAVTATTYNVTVNAIPSNPTITGSLTACAGSTGNTYTTESGMTNYTWTIQSGGIITSGLGTNQVTVNWNTAGKREIRVNYSNASGCYASSAAFDSVTVNSITTPAITGSTTACVGATNITYTTQAGMNNYDWQVSSGGTIASGAGTYQVKVNWNTVGANTISVNFNNANGCKATNPTKQTVNVITKPVPTITGSSSTCLNATNTYTTESGMNNYTWTVSAGGTILAGSSTNAVTIKWTTAGSQTVTVNYNAAGNCTADAPTSYNVTVNTPNIPTLTGADTVCANNSSYAFTTDAGMTNYTWSLSGGGGVITSGAGTNQIKVAWSTGGTKYVYINYLNSNGCQAASPTSVKVIALSSPAPTITGTNDVCIGATGITYTTEPGMIGYTWNISSGGTITSGLGTNTITVNWNNSGSQFVSVNYSNSNGCSAATAKVYSVNVNAIPVPTIAGSNGGCLNSTTTYTTESGMLNYSWDVSSGGTILSGNGTNTITVKWNNYGNETVSVTYKLPAGCEPISPTVKNVSITANPTVALSADNTIICAGEPVNFTATSGIYNYDYYVNGTSVYSGSNSTYSSTSLANGDQIYVVASTINGCTATSTPNISMTVYDKPTAGLTVVPSMPVAQNTTMTFTATGGGLYEFLVNGTVVQNYSTNAIYSSSSLNNNDVVTVYVMSLDGCLDSAKITMNILGSIQAKSVLSSAIIYCSGSNGVTIYINNPESGVNYQLIRVSDNYNYGLGTVSGSVVKWDNVKNASVGSADYKVMAFYPAFPTNQVEMSNRVTITEIASPTIYTISPTGTVNDCNSGSGYNIQLSGSQTGVNYTLYRNGSTTGITVAGTGSSISFGNQTTNGVYTIVAQNTSAGCSSTMNGTFTINIVSGQTIYDLNANPSNGHYCSGGSGVALTLSGSTVGVNYNLMRDAGTLVKTMAGTGSVLNFGNYTTEGVYTVTINVSGCTSSMNGSIQVVKDDAPVAYTLIASNNGYYCEGGNGISLSLSNQEVGVDYQLMINGSAVSSPVTGTIAGAILDFPGYYTTEGVYSVVESKSGVSCTTNSLNSIVVHKTALPKDLTITGDNTFCESAGSGKLNIINSESDVTYTLYLDGVATTTSSVGNGGILSFNINQEGTYTVQAVRNSSSETCPTMLSGSLVVTKSTGPVAKNYTWINGIDCNNGTVITIEQTQVGVTYTLYSRATGAPVSGYSIVGDGSDMNFPEIIDSNGDYYIVAQNGACSMEMNALGDIFVTIPGALQKMEVTQPATICAGDNNVYIGLKNTDSAITYELYLVGGDISTGNDLKVQTLIGNGSAMSFPSVITSEGTYYVKGINNSVVPACYTEMLNRVTIKFNPLPIAYTLTGSGFYCTGMTGATIGLSNSEVGTTYYLQYDSGSGKQTVDQAIGSGGSLSFSNLSAEGTYTMYASSIYGCTSNMTNNITVKKVPDPDIFSVSVDNTSYCNGATGADLIISGTQKDVNYIITDLSTDTKTTYVATSNSNTPVKLANLPEGFYTVEATWGGDACYVSMTGSPIEIDKAPVPTNNFTIDIADILICTGATTKISVTNVETGLYYDLEKDGILQNLPINSSINEVKWTVSGAANSNSTYRVFAYANGYKGCGLYSTNTVSLQVKNPPIAYNLSPANASFCKGTSGVGITVSGSENNIIYELYDASSTRVDYYIPTAINAGSPFSFSNLVTTGTYNVVAKYVTGNCVSTMNNSVSVTEDDSSFTCFPFEVIKDTIYLSAGDKTGSKYVSDNTKGGNDILSSIVDVNLEYKLITSWTDANNNTAQTKGSLSFDSNIKDYVTYTKPSQFYGKDSVIYEITNLDHKNRKDTAIIYIFVGNQELEEGRTFIIPNAFSPNGDGKNDLYVIEGFDDQLSSDLEVFNRWGTMVYKSNGEKYLNNWDGYGNKGVVSIGKELPVGTYFYIYKVSYMNKAKLTRKTFSGYIELRR